VEFRNGTRVEIAGRDVLEDFFQSWASHHKLDSSQLDYAGRTAEVESHSIYHNGDVLYRLKDIPGIWHQHMLSLGEGRTEIIMGFPLIRRQEGGGDFIVRLAVNMALVAIVNAAIWAGHGWAGSQTIALFIGGLLGAIPATTVEHRWELLSQISKAVFVIFVGGGAALTAALWGALR
jgi:hypothetical protein